MPISTVIKTIDNPCREKYLSFFDKCANTSIFHAAWWLDITCPEGWQYVGTYQNEELVAALPFRISKKFGIFKIFDMPHLTQRLGPLILFKTTNPQKKISEFHKHLQDIIQDIPRCDYFNCRMDHKMPNWLPFYWKGYSQTTKYTYLLDLERSDEELFKNFKTSTRTDIRKAEKSGVTVDTTADIGTLLTLCKSTFQRKGGKSFFNSRILKKLYIQAKQRECAQIIVSYQNKIPCAGVLLVWNNTFCHYLVGASNPEYRGNGAHTLAIWEAIKLSRSKSKYFDFEGSMIKNVEASFRSFGATHTPYSHIYRCDNILIRVLSAMKNAKNG